VDYAIVLQIIAGLPAPARVFLGNEPPVEEVQCSSITLKDCDVQVSQLLITVTLYI
jgi:hypothetical protein